jgi:hypothetical protein
VVNGANRDRPGIRRRRSVAFGKSRRGGLLNNPSYRTPYVRFRFRPFTARAHPRGKFIGRKTEPVIRKKSNRTSTELYRARRPSFIE